MRHPHLVYIGDVYRPSDDSWLLVDTVLSRKPSGDICLDLGSGSGVQGLYALLNNICRRVFFIDISEDAVDTTRLNVELNEAWMSIVVWSDDIVIRENTVDIVLANPPYLPSEGESIVDMAVEAGPRGYEAILQFIDYASKALKRGGLLYLVYSSLSNPGVIKDHLLKRGFRIIYSNSKEFFFEEIFVVECVKLD